MSISLKCKNEMQRYFVSFTSKISLHNVYHLSPSIIKNVEINTCYGKNKLEYISYITSISMNSLQVVANDKEYVTSIVKDLNAFIEKNNLDIMINYGENTIILKLNPPSEEKRKELVKYIKQECEKAKVTVRQIRKNYNNKTDKNFIKKDIQEYTDEYISKIDEFFTHRNKVIMEEK